MLRLQLVLVDTSADGSPMNMWVLITSTGVVNVVTAKPLSIEAPKCTPRPSGIPVTRIHAFLASS